MKFAIQFPEKTIQDGADIQDDCSTFPRKNLKIKKKPFRYLKSFINKISFFNASDMIYSLFMQLSCPGVVIYKVILTTTISIFFKRI